MTILYLSLLLLCFGSSLGTHTIDDFVIAFCSCTRNLRLAHTTRCMRRGIRTFISIEDENAVGLLNEEARLHRETYAFFPDSNQSKPSRRGRHEGRWLMTPILAHLHYKSSYKWMLLGDDDTVWLPTGVLTLLRPYDHTLPYLISDSIAQLEVLEGSDIPRMAAGKADAGSTLCLPCHSTVSEGAVQKGCPCSSKQGCATRRATRNIEVQYDRLFLGSEDRLCTSPSSAIGGHGIIISFALLEMLESEGFIEKARALASEPLARWGDYALAELIFELGYSVTFPDESMASTGHLDHPSYKLFGLGFSSGGILSKIDEIVIDSSRIEHQKCTLRNCSWLVIHAVSLHIHREKSRMDLVEHHLSNILCPRIKKGLLFLGEDASFIAAK
jgi:hypothetical protein